jgi:hypothetical protein
VVRAERFELPTFWFVARRSIQLSYARMRTLKDYQTGSKTPSGFRRARRPVAGRSPEDGHGLVGIDDTSRKAASNRSTSSAVL